ncbi:MAG: hypothetical protein JW745_01320, partial [Sedimentisphaerales bacterium]|nr:hypothetical protein [Sedimentisphaerales bacterium]
LLLLLLLAAVLIYGLVRAPKKTLTVVSVLLIALVLVAGIRLVLHRQGIELSGGIMSPGIKVTVSGDDLPAVSAPAPAVETEVMQNIWQEKLELELRPDKYSSAVNALNAAMKDIAGHEYLNPQVSATAQAAADSPAASMLMNPEKKLFICDVTPGRFTAQELQNAVDVFKDNHKGAVRLAVSVIGQDKLAEIAALDPQPFVIRIACESETITKAYSLNKPENSNVEIMGTGSVAIENGLVSLILSGPQGAEHSDTRQYTQADWMTDLAGYTRNMSASSVVVTGASEPACISAERARQQAVEALAANFNKAMAQGELLNAGVVQENELMRDIFIQQLSTSQGIVWRARALGVADISKLRLISETARDIFQQSQIQRQVHEKESLLQILTSLFYILLGITGTWFLADYVTRGYYRGRIIIALVILLIVVIIMLCQS